jgi:hypothetical protein
METIIYLTPEEAKIFLDFKKYQDEFIVLLSSGVFTLKGGSMTIHKDAEGTVRKIETNKILFFK